MADIEDAKAEMEGQDPEDVAIARAMGYGGGGSGLLSTVFSTIGTVASAGIQVGGLDIGGAARAEAEARKAEAEASVGNADADFGERIKRAMVGGAAGAVAGSILPGVGTMLGAVGGAVVGFATGE